MRQGVLPRMNSMPKERGRKPKPFSFPWNNETIDCLYKCPGDRWRIVSIGES